MHKARYLVEAHIQEGRPVAELAKAHGVHRSWIYKLLARYREGGYEALEPRSRRPRSCPHQASEELVAAIVALRRELVAQGHDAGAQTIAYHLRAEFEQVPSVATIWRVLRRQGLVRPQPQKRPRCALIRFQAELPNELWQADVTHWRLAAGEEVAVLNLIDDHSRLLLAADAYRTVKAEDVVHSFRRAVELHGAPASLLTDNAAVFTARPRGGKVLLETELERLGIACKNSRPYHPQTCGKVERLHQTLKGYLAKQRPAGSIQGLQAQLDAFGHYYNNIRPHRALDGKTPLSVFAAKVKARPAEPRPETHLRVRKDRVDGTGKVTLRHDSRLLHLGIGRAHKGRRVTLLVADLEVRVLDAAGEPIGRFLIDPVRNYQPMRAP